MRYSFRYCPICSRHADYNPINTKLSCINCKLIFNIKIEVFES